MEYYDFKKFVKLHGRVCHGKREYAEYIFSGFGYTICPDG